MGLRRTLTRRRSCRTRSRFVRAGRGFGARRRRCRFSGFRMARWRRGWTICLRTSRRRLCRGRMFSARRRRCRFSGFRTARWRRGRTICLRTGRLRLTRLRRGLCRGRTIRLNRSRSWPLIRSGLIARAVCRLIRRRRRRLAGSRSCWLVRRLAHRRRRRFARRRLLHHRTRCRRGCRTQSRHFMLCQRHAGMRCHRLLSRGERHRRRWGSLLRDYLPVHHRRRWRRDMARGRGLRSKHCLPRGSHCNPRAHRRGRDLLRIHRDRRPRDRLCAREGALWNRRHRALHAPVRICNVRDSRGPVDDGRVIDIRDRGDVHGRVADVHLIHVTRADVVGRHPNLPRTERKPSNISAPAAAGANKDHQRRRVDRLHRHGPGYPTPAPAYRDPTPVVERRVAP